MTALPSAEGIRRLFFYGGPAARLMEAMENSPENALSVQVLYHLALRHGVLSPSIAAEGLTMLPETSVDALAGRQLLEKLQAQGEFLAVRVVR